jgi:hypothetical protein
MVAFPLPLCDHAVLIRLRSGPHASIPAPAPLPCGTRPTPFGLRTACQITTLPGSTDAPYRARAPVRAPGMSESRFRALDAGFAEYEAPRRARTDYVLATYFV